MSRSDIILEQAPKTEFDGTNTYRSLDRLSYSSLSTFQKDRKKFYKQFILKEPVEEIYTDAMRMGDLVDVILTDETQVDNRFVFTTAEKPSGQLLDLTDTLWKIYKTNINPEGEITREFSSMFEEAFKQVKFDKNGEEIAFKKKTLEGTLLRFNSEAKDYFDELRNNYGKIVITLQERENADKIVESLRTNFVSKDLINRQSTKSYEVLRKYAVLYEVEGQKMKSELDFLEIDHKRQIITPTDLKISWSVEEFHYNYLKMNYYLQASLYVYACRQLVKERGLKNYLIRPFQFLVSDSCNYYNPLLFRCNLEDIENGLHGFRINHRRYKGCFEIIKEIAWHVSSDEWAISYDNYHNKGIVPIGVVYDTPENKK